MVWGRVLPFMSERIEVTGRVPSDFMQQFNHNVTSTFVLSGSSMSNIEEEVALHALKSRMPKTSLNTDILIIFSTPRYPWSREPTKFMNPGTGPCRKAMLFLGQHQ